MSTRTAPLSEALDIKPISINQLWQDLYTFRKESQEKWAAREAADKEREKWEGRFWKLITITVALGVALAGSLGTLLGMLLRR